MATTTDQKLTLSEALSEARALGFTDVLYPFGWQPIGDLTLRKIQAKPTWQLVTIDGKSYVRSNRLRYELRRLSDFPRA